MDYKIIAFYPETGQVVIRYRDDMPTMAIDIPLTEDGLFMAGEELNTYIKGFIPTWHFERLDKLKNGVANADVIASLVTPEPVSPEVEAQAVANTELDTNAAMWEQVETERKIGDILVKFGLLQVNPATIPVAVE